MGMIDKRQIIYDIERCICHVPEACIDCSHYTGTGGLECIEELMSDTLVLLKDQEKRKLRLALDITKGTCNGIKTEGLLPDRYKAE